VKKLEGHATIKLSADVLASLRTISPETYTGIFTPGAELEVKCYMCVLGYSTAIF
jgi:hypothetical protein